MASTYCKNCGKEILVWATANPNKIDGVYCDAVCLNQAFNRKQIASVTDVIEVHSTLMANDSIKKGYILLHIYTRRAETDTPGIYMEYPVYVMGKLPK